MSTSLDTTPSQAAWAKAALKYLAEHQLAPTPHNYALAWRAVGGAQEPDRADRADHADRVDRTPGPPASPPSARWGGLLSDVLGGLDTAHRGWTRARKRDSVARLIDSSSRRDDLLAERLAGLVASWSRSPLDEPPESLEEEAAAKAAAANASSPAGEPSRARLQRNEKLLAEMTELLAALCDSLATVSEDTSWVRGQAEVLRESLAAPLDHRALSEVRNLLAQTTEVQRVITHRRRESLGELKQMLAKWVESMASLADSTDQFGARMVGHAQRIERSDSLDALAGTVQSLIADTGAMRATIEQSQSGLATTRARALALETEVSRLEDQLASASTQIVTDHLTGTMNRRGLEESFEGALQRSREWRSPLNLAVLDVDDFKKLNDALGHQGGDHALRQLARILKDKARSNDAVARYGGEEFVLLLPGLSVTEAVEQMQRLQREVTSHVFMFESQRSFITFSAGVTEVREDDSMASAVGRADEAMFAAKHDGKNCVRRG